MSPQQVPVQGRLFEICIDGAWRCCVLRFQGRSSIRIHCSRMMAPANVAPFLLRLEDHTYFW